MPVVPKLAIDLGISPAGIGRINAAFFLTAGLAAFPLGRLSDLVGKKQVALAGLTLLAAGALILAFSSAFLQLIAGYVLIGFGMAAFGSGMMSLVADLAAAARLGRAYGWYTLTLYAGMSFGPALGGFLAGKMVLSRVLLVSAVLTALVVGMAKVLMPTTGVVSKRPDHPPVGGSTVGALLRNHPLLGCWSATFGACFSMGMFLSFYPVYAYAKGYKPGQVGVVFLFHGVGNALVRLPSGYFSDRIGDRRLLVFLGLAGCSLAMTVLGLANSLVMANAGAALLGLSLGTAFPSLGASVGGVVPSHLRGAAMGGFNACIFLGMLANAVIMGMAIETIGYRSCFLLSALVNGVLAGAALALMRSMYKQSGLTV